MFDKQETEKMIEDAVGNLHRGLFRMRSNGDLLDAYDVMGILIDILMEDRETMRKNGLPEREKKEETTND